MSSSLSFRAPADGRVRRVEAAHSTFGSGDLESERDDLRHALIVDRQLNGQLLPTSLLLRDGNGAAARAGAGELPRAELRRARIALRKDRGRCGPPVGRQLQSGRHDDEPLAGLRAGGRRRLDVYRIDLGAIRVQRVVVSPFVWCVVEGLVCDIDRPAIEVEYGCVAELASVHGDQDLAGVTGDLNAEIRRLDPAGAIPMSEEIAVAVDIEQIVRSVVADVATQRIGVAVDAAAPQICRSRGNVSPCDPGDQL